MPIPGAKFRVKTTNTGKKVRLAFKKGKVVEAKRLTPVAAPKAATKPTFKPGSTQF